MGNYHLISCTRCFKTCYCTKLIKLLFLATILIISSCAVGSEGLVGASTSPYFDPSCSCNQDHWRKFFYNWVIFKYTLNPWCSNPYYFTGWSTFFTKCSCFGLTVSIVNLTWSCNPMSYSIWACAWESRDGISLLVSIGFVWWVDSCYLALVLVWFVW